MNATIGQRMGHIFAQIRGMVSLPLPSNPGTVGRDASRAQRQRASIMFLAFLGAVGAGFVPPAEAAPTAADSTTNSDIGILAIQGPYLIWARHSQLCVEVKNGSLSNSAQIEQNSCTNIRRQLWNFEDTTNGYYRIWNVASKKCLNVRGASKANSAKVIQFTCGGSGALNDQWKPQKVRTAGGRDFYRLVNRQSDKCLNVQGGKKNSGDDLIQFTCGNGNGNDEFTWDRP